MLGFAFLLLGVLRLISTRHAHGACTSSAKRGDEHASRDGERTRLRRANSAEGVLSARVTPRTVLKYSPLSRVSCSQAAPERRVAPEGIG